jgi:hypothetical protein
MVSTMVGENFCKRVGNECADATRYIVEATMGVAIGTGYYGQNIQQDDEAARIVKAAVERQIARGWDELQRNHLTVDEQRAYADALAKGEIARARAIMGTALQAATAEDLNRTSRMPNGMGRFDSRRTGGVDFTDRMTGAKVELTTYGSYLRHWLRGGDYRTAQYVLYKGPGRLPPGTILLRGGGRGGR